MSTFKSLSFFVNIERIFCVNVKNVNLNNSTYLLMSKLILENQCKYLSRFVGQLTIKK